jgi:hypothetical protein
MKIKTWEELWPDQRLVAAELAHNLAAKALAHAQSALSNINQPSARCVALKAEIKEEGRRFLAAVTREEMDMIDTRREELYEALCNEEIRHEETQPERWDALEEEIGLLTDALSKARGELDHVQMRVEMANHHDAPGPIQSYGTRSEAVRAICAVRLEKNQLGETYAQIGDVRVRITGDTSLAAIPPSSLNWTLNSDASHTLALLPGISFPSRVVHIEEGDEIFVGRNADKQVQVSSHLSKQSVSYAQAFGSLESALSYYFHELRELQFIDLSDDKPLPILGEVIRDACEAFAADTASRPKFLPEKGRLSEEQIYKLVGAYWKAFLEAPWEPAIEGTYALLKHRCKRGETPNVFSCDTHGHFGFRVRTPDHDWIMGEIYCPPDYFSPAKLPELKIINRHVGRDWLAELGPVKFLIRGNTSRS